LNDDAYYMRIALEEAQKAAELGEVPVGAVLVVDDEVIARNHNRRETTPDPTAHAEILVLSEAAQKLGKWRLPKARLFVTLEPCPMCAGALVLARIERLIYGAEDPKTGAVDSLYSIATDGRLNHRIQVVKGVLADECSELLKGFFRERRQPGIVL
jgi:tRNA(adenine34) deaminase